MCWRCLRRWPRLRARVPRGWLWPPQWGGDELLALLAWARGHSRGSMAADQLCITALRAAQLSAELWSRTPNYRQCNSMLDVEVWFLSIKDEGHMALISTNWFGHLRQKQRLRVTCKLLWLWPMALAPPLAIAGRMSALAWVPLALAAWLRTAGIPRADHERLSPQIASRANNS